MLVPDNLTIWLRQQIVPIAIIALAVLGIYFLLKISAQRRHAALAAERSGVTEETFVEHLAQYNFDPLICGTTYRYLQEVQRVNFPILPSDKLDEDLGLDLEDVEQTVRELLVSLQRSSFGGLRHKPLLTVEDLIRYLQATPRKEQVVAA